jgi:hypothetical protein
MSHYQPSQIPAEIRYYKDATAQFIPDLANSSFEVEEGGGKETGLVDPFEIEENDLAQQTLSWTLYFDTAWTALPSNSYLLDNGEIDILSFYLDIQNSSIYATYEQARQAGGQDIRNIMLQEVSSLVPSIYDSTPEIISRYIFEKAQSMCFSKAPAELVEIRVPIYPQDITPSFTSIIGNLQVQSNGVVLEEYFKPVRHELSCVYNNRLYNQLPERSDFQQVSFYR